MPPSRSRPIASVPLPDGVAGVEVMWKVLEILTNEHGARVTDVDVTDEAATAEVVLPRPRPAA
ncbi:MAG: hypothetical protein ABR600_09400 [Actinomycetota bacterium]